MPMRDPDSWDDVFMAVAFTIARRSKDGSFQAGAVVVDTENRILGVGFNGPPPQVDDALVPWDERKVEPTKYRHILHADENAVTAALEAYGRRRVEGGTLYVNGRPCSGCVLRTVAAGIVRCVYAAAGPQARMCDDDDWKVVEAIVGSLKPGKKFRLVPYGGAA